MKPVPWNWYVTTAFQIAAFVICLRFRRVSAYMPALLVGFGVTLVVALTFNVYAVTGFWYTGIGRATWNFYARIVGPLPAFDRMFVICGLYLVLADLKARAAGRPAVIQPNTTRVDGDQPDDS